MTKSLILTAPHPQLRAPNKPITILDKKTKSLLKTLREQLILSDGVGLAAPQIGYNYRVFVTDLRRALPSFPPSKNPFRFFINPVISSHSERKITAKEDDGNYTLEGCLSLPHLYAAIPRYPNLELSFFEPDLTTGQLVAKRESFSDYFARNVQHELDHLDNILFVDYLKGNDLLLYRTNQQTGQLEEIDKSFIYGY
ncbi:peptide deformylase [Microgenomates group bacterium]|nr:peptide deformylase [Microgenomates group bacterium]